MADKFHFSIGGEPIPTMSEKPIKSFGKFFNSSLRDTASIKGTFDGLQGLLGLAVHKSKLLVKFKGWIYFALNSSSDTVATTFL